VIQSIANQSAVSTGAAGDFGVNLATTPSGAPVAGTSPMSRAYPYGVVVAGAGVSAGVVVLQGSLDGVNWYTISSLTLTVPGVFPLPPPSPPIPARYVRAAITTIITGGTISAQVDAAP
jgi:hypothetical protein